MEPLSSNHFAAIGPEAIQPLPEQGFIFPELKSQPTSDWSHGVHFESLANLAHELRTPVQVLLGYLDILCGDQVDGGVRNTAQAADDRKILERMNANAHELAQTVDNVLEFALALANADNLVEEEIELVQLFGEMDEILRASNSNPALALSINLDDAPRTVVMRRRPLRSIVLNLAGNALKFTATGEVKIAVTGTDEPLGLEIAVRDTGTGISRDLLSLALDPLVQLSHSSIRHHRGLGLGLTLVQFHVKSLGGRLQVETGPGVGSCFKVSIPCSGSTS
jgi:signal transduction histidine kinase